LLAGCALAFAGLSLQVDSASAHSQTWSSERGGKHCVGAPAAAALPASAHTRSALEPELAGPVPGEAASNPFDVSQAWPDLLFRRHQHMRDLLRAARGVDVLRAPDAPRPGTDDRPGDAERSRADERLREQGHQPVDSVIDAGAAAREPDLP
jgi:hypothetical protein